MATRVAYPARKRSAASIIPALCESAEITMSSALAGESSATSAQPSALGVEYRRPGTPATISRPDIPMLRRPMIQRLTGLRPWSRGIVLGGLLARAPGVPRRGQIVPQRPHDNTGGGRQGPLDVL